MTLTYVLMKRHTTARSIGCMVKPHKLREHVEDRRHPQKEGHALFYAYHPITVALSWQLAIRRFGFRPGRDRTGVNPRAEINEETSPSVSTPCV
jgi:hypothetical protein